MSETAFYLWPFGMLMAAFGLVVAVSAVRPGKMGRITVGGKAVYAKAKVPEIMGLLAERAEYERFLVGLPDELAEKEGEIPGESWEDAVRREMGDAPQEGELLLYRPKSKEGGGLMGTLADKELDGVMEFRQAGENVEVKVRMTFLEWVARDTGEGEYTRRMIRRLLHADLKREPHPVIKMASGYAILCCYLGIVVMLASLWVFIGAKTKDEGAFVVAQMGIGVVTTLSMAFLGGYQIVKLKEHYDGWGYMAAGIPAAIVGVAIAAAVTSGLPEPPEEERAAEEMEYYDPWAGRP